MKIVLQILLFFWQIPQIVIGFIYLLFFVKVKRKEKYKDRIILYIDKVYKFGISFGYQIFLSDDARGRELLIHEYGHSIQSALLGPFYLLLVGLPSIVRYIIFFRFKMKKADTQKEKLKIRDEYYHGYPENWADNLGKGGVKKI